MSVSKGFVLDDDGGHDNFSSMDSSTDSASENDSLEQKLGKMIQKCIFENQIAVQQTIQNLQMFTKLSGNEAYSMLLPLISLIKEKDDHSFKQAADHEDITKRLHESLQKERERRVRVPDFVMKIFEWMLDKDVTSAEELEEEWKAARQTRIDLFSRLEDNIVQLECARKRAHDQTALFEQVQKECDDLKKRNRKLCKQLEGARSKIRKMKVRQESEQKQFVLEKERSSVGSSEYNAELLEHMEKKSSSQVELKVSESEVAKIVPTEVKSEEEICDHKVENGFLSNGQSEVDKMAFREDSTEDKVDESVCMDIIEESTEGNVEDSKAVLCSGDQKSDEFQRCRTESTHDNIKDFKKIELVTETKQSNEKFTRGEINEGSRNVEVYQSQENVQSKEIGFQSVIEKFDILASMDLKEQFHERIAVLETLTVIEEQINVSEIKIEPASENSKEKEESNVQDKKANDFWKSQGPPMRLLSMSSNLDQYENESCVVFERDAPNEDPILTPGKPPPLEKQDPKKAGEGACGFVLETRTNRRIQEEPYPRKDPPVLSHSKDTSDSQVNSDQVQVLLHQEFQPRKDPPQPQLYSVKNTSVLQVIQDQVKTRLHQEFRPRKDPPQMHPDDTTDVKSQPEQLGVHLHQEFRPRKDPPCREHHHHTMSQSHYGSITGSWSNFVIDVH
ncbi:unnamed protein product [Caenorhabditis nigoni]